MVKIVGVLSLICATWVYSLPFTSSSLNSIVLDNGLKVVVKVDHRAPVFISQVWYQVGASNEQRPLTGVSHMLEHMMFKGTSRYPIGEFSRIIARNGGQENAFTSKDYTAYYQKMHRSKLALALELEADRMQNLVFSEVELTQERQVVIEERRMRVEDNPNAKVYEQLNLLAFDSKGAYSYPVIGFKQDIEQYQLNDLKNWYQQYYVPNKATLVVVGDVDPQKVFKLAQRYFGQCAPSSLSVQSRPSVALKGGKKILKIQAKLPYYVLAFHVPSLLTDKNNEAYSLKMLSYLLSDSLNKHLLREKQIVSSIGASYALYDKYNTLFNLNFVPAKGVSSSLVLSEVRYLVAQFLRQTKDYQGLLARLKIQIESEFVFSQDEISTQAYYLGMGETVGLGAGVVNDFVHNMNQISLNDIRKVAQKYLDFNQANQVELIPQEM
jgi:zinc protease